MAVEVVAQWLKPEDDLERLRQAVEAANRRVFEVGQARPDLQGMGTTLTVCLITAAWVRVAHVGDSRAYRLTAEGLERLTTDHSVAAEMERSGSLSPQEAAHHPQRHVLTRAVGPLPSVPVDLGQWPRRSGDRILVCSDGLVNAVPEPAICQVLAHRRGQAGVEALIQAALEGGGEDNITVVLVEEDDQAREVPHGR